VMWREGKEGEEGIIVLEDCQFRTLDPPRISFELTQRIYANGT